MKANAGQIRAALSAPSPAIRLFLLHGADEAGAADLARLVGRALGDEAERIDLDGAMLKGDPARLLDEAASLSLFGGPRWIRVAQAGEESLTAFTALLAATQGTSPVVALAPTVRTTAKIVKLATDSPQAMAHACYQPDAAGAERLVGTIAAEHGLTLDAGVAARLVAATGGDRAVMTREVEKFALFLDAAPDRPQRVAQDALDALGAALDEGETQPIVAALVEGDAATLGQQLALATERGTSPIPWLRQLARRLIQLLEMREEVARGEPVGSVMKKHRVFFREEAATGAALRRWTPAMLSEALTRVRAAERAVTRPGNAGGVLAVQPRKGEGDGTSTGAHPAHPLSPAAMAPDPLPQLQRVFGFPAFRGVQADVVARVLNGERTLAVMPTGAGKSLCYQLPATMLEGTCVVVSPLIALMHDQLRAAEAVGIRAGTLTSADDNRAATIARFREGALDLLYVAPERASSAHFREMLGQGRLSLFAIDEAHCVSEWGHDFRPDYRLLSDLMDAFPAVGRLALTATADAHTRADILTQLGIPAEGLIVSGFDRPNIRYAIQPKDNVNRQIADLLAKEPGPGIVYAQTRAATEKLAEALGRSGRPVRAYHAGLDPAVRAKNQADFVASEDMVICATVAFGMGIDKPDVRFVAHAGLPKSIEAYYQETGRAGRDGDPAVAHLFWGAEDFARARQRIGEVETARQPGERARLQSLGALVETAGCRRRILLRHFGEEPDEDCGNCDNCLSSPDAVDATEVARKFLSAVFRTGQLFGATYVEQVLLGQSSERSLTSGHEALSVWGIVDGEEVALVKPVARALLLRDALRTNAHGGLEFGPGARGILKGEARVALVLPPKRERRSKRSAAAAPAIANPHDAALFEALRQCRRDLAKEAGVPPYVVFHDSTLRDMAAQRPATRAALGVLSGIGARKLDAYGDAFLAVIRGFA